MSDNHSRFLLCCEGLAHPTLKETLKQCERIFRDYGLPDAIRTDNGQPFAGIGLGGLTQLSIWWVKLGIIPERIDLGCPEQNGRHERMHRTLKEATALPSEKTMRAQQKSFDRFKREYNYERPHESLAGKRPADVYVASEKTLLSKAPEMVYPHDYEVRKIRSNGEIKWGGKKYYVSELLCGEPLGFEMIDEGKASIYFGKLKLGVIDARLDKIIKF
jgi:putative transposase